MNETLETLNDRSRKHVVVKQGSDFPHATVLEVAKNGAGKSIYRVTHFGDSEGYWIDGNRVFEVEEENRSQRMKSETGE